MLYYGSQLKGHTVNWSHKNY